MEAQHRERSQPNKYVRGDMATSPGGPEQDGVRGKTSEMECRVKEKRHRNRVNRACAHSL